MIFTPKQAFRIRKAALLFLLTISTVFFYTQNSAAQMIAPPSNIEPNHCRIVGKIIEILPVKTTKNATRPCEKYPCQARVQVLQVLGTGVGFHTPLSINKNMTVKFAFTLQPTQKLFPELNQALPGLATGDKFQADIQQLETMGKQASSFTVFTYKKQ